jgi:DNA-binding transcriptional LysR family regulator
MQDFLLHRIKTFTSVVEQQSFAAAARQLGLSQPAVGMQIRGLEKQLGMRLIARIGPRCVPTEAGVELLKHAHNINGAVSAALESISQYNTSDAVRLRLGVDPSASFLLPPRYWRTLQQKMPDLEIQIHCLSTADIADGLYKDLLDLGLVNLTLARRPLEVRSILHDELLLASASDDMRIPKKPTPTALAALPLLIYEPGGELRRIVQGWFSREGVALRPLMEIGDLEAVKQLVITGLGYSILPHLAIAEDERSSFALRHLSPRIYQKFALVVKEEVCPLNPSLQRAIDLFDKRTLVPGARAPAFSKGGTRKQARRADSESD